MLCILSISYYYSYINFVDFGKLRFNDVAVAGELAWYFDFTTFLALSISISTKQFRRGLQQIVEFYGYFSII